MATTLGKSDSVEQSIPEYINVKGGGGGGPVPAETINLDKAISRLAD